MAGEAITESGQYHLTKIPASHRNFKSIALVTPDDDFAQEIISLPIGIRTSRYKGYEPNLADRVQQRGPDAIVVCSSGTAAEPRGRNVCEILRRKVNAPLLFVNRGDYPDSCDFSSFTDVDVREPRHIRDFLNLGIEIMRLAYDVPVPTVQLGLVQARHRSTVRWILTVGALVAILSGGITLAVQRDPQAAIQAMVTTFSAITSVEIGVLFRGYLRNRAIGSDLEPSS